MTYCSSVEPIGLPVASPKYLAVKFVSSGLEKNSHEDTPAVKHPLVRRGLGLAPQHRCPLCLWLPMPQSWALPHPSADGCSSVFNLCLRRGSSILWGGLRADAAIYKEALAGCPGGPGEAPSRGSRELGMPWYILFILLVFLYRTCSEGMFILMKV